MRCQKAGAIFGVGILPLYRGRERTTMLGTALIPIWDAWDGTSKVMRACARGWHLRQD